MWYIVAIGACILSGIAGLTIGSTSATSLISNLEWQFFRWDKTVFGFRPINVSTKIFPGDRIVMGIPLRTDELPEAGINLQDFLNLSQIEKGELP